MKQLADYIRNIPDFPKEGVIFRDITTVIQDPEGFHLSIDMLKECIKDVDFDMFAPIEARGFVFASPLAYEFEKGIALVRKKGKLPYKTVEASYDLEYGSATIEMHADSIEPGQKVILVDDLIATGGTLMAAADLVEKLGGEVAMILAVIDLPGLGGSKKLGEKYTVKTLVSFDGE